MKVQVNLFTGKSIGEYTAVKNDETANYEVTLKNGQTAAFNMFTLKQVNAPKPQFACKLVLLEKQTSKRTKRAAAPSTVEFKASWTGEMVTLDASNLTKMETAVMVAARNNEYCDCMESGTWSFTVNDNAEGVGHKQFSGVCSSLIKKGYAGVADPGTDDAIFYLTQEGKKLFSDYNPQ